FGDTDGNYKNWTPNTGSYTLKATPYTEAGGKGTAGKALTVNFTVVSSSTSPSQTPEPSTPSEPATPPSPSPGQQSVVSFSLMNADTDKEIKVISTGAVLNLATLPTRNLNIRVNTNPTLVGSVKMELTGRQTRTQTETAAPYALFGDTDGNYKNWTPNTGSYTLKATPYTEAGGKGTAGKALTINFTVVSSVINQATGVSSPSGALTAFTDPEGDSLAYTVSGLPPVPARLSAESPHKLQVVVLGNPVSDQIRVEVLGAEGKPLRLLVTDLSGWLVAESQVDQASAVERPVLSVSKAANGMLLLQVITPGDSITVKVMKVQ
ncbi:MAG: hypothetical protein ACO1O2_24600, partial [Larkinella arboricola]